MNRALETGICAVLGACLAAGPVGAQVTRVRGGHALDANYEVGSGGTNAPVVSRPTTASQLYITGQVSGLGSFQGPVGYYAPNELYMNVPSAGQKVFRRQSVSLQEVLSGPTYITVPYHDRSDTAFHLRRIISGQTVPGSDVPLVSAISPVRTRDLAEQARKEYGPIGTVPAGGALSSQVSQVGALDPRRTAPSPPRTARPGIGTARPTGVMIPRPADSVFGIAHSQKQQELAEELYELAQKESGLVAPIDARVENRIDAEASGTKERAKPVDDATQEDGVPDKPQEIRPATPTGRVLPARGQDVYLDLLRDLTREQPSRPGKQASPGPFEKIAEIAKPVELPEGSAERAPEDEEAEAQDEWAKIGTEPTAAQLPRKPVVLYCLAGKSKDLFNIQMTRAQKSLLDGKYYAAGDEYRLAIIINPENPLAQIGLGLSLFCAGEPLSAGMHMTRAMRIFPPLMETHVDVPAMLGELGYTNRFQPQLSRVTERLAASAGAGQSGGSHKDEALLAFISTYLHYCINDSQGARSAAKRLESLAPHCPDRQLYQALAKFILTGKRPRQQK